MSIREKALAIINESSSIKDPRYNDTMKRKIEAVLKEMYDYDGNSILYNGSRYKVTIDMSKPTQTNSRYGEIVLGQGLNMRDISTSLRLVLGHLSTPKASLKNNNKLTPEKIKEYNNMDKVVDDIAMKHKFAH